jgi:hypothetical protein
VFTEEKLNALVAFLTAKLGKAGGLEKCVLAMDRTAVLYLWETLARGKECGEICQDQIDATEGTVYPGWTKTVRQEPSARIELATPGERGRSTFLESASELVKVLADNGIDIGETGFLFRAQNRSRTGFNDKPITSSALQKRIQKRLQEAGLFKGETLHSFRRSAVQHAAIELKYDVREVDGSRRMENIFILQIIRGGNMEKIAHWVHSHFRVLPLFRHGMSCSATRQVEWSDHIECLLCLILSEMNVLSSISSQTDHLYGIYHSIRKALSLNSPGFAVFDGTLWLALHDPVPLGISCL